MRCMSCNEALTDYEATRKSPSGEYVDLCNSCFRYIKNDILTIERPDLEGILDDITVDKDDDYGY